MEATSVNLVRVILRFSVAIGFNKGFNSDLYVLGINRNLDMNTRLRGVFLGNFML